MKIIERMVEKALDTSPKLIETLTIVSEKIELIIDRVNKDAATALNLITRTTERINDITAAVVNITKTLELHQKAITDLYSAQNAINSALSDKRSTIDLPEIKKNKDEKPN